MYSTHGVEKLPEVASTAPSSRLLVPRKARYHVISSRRRSRTPLVLQTPQAAASANSTSAHNNSNKSNAELSSSKRTAELVTATAAPSVTASDEHVQTGSTGRQSTAGTSSAAAANGKAHHKTAKQPQQQGASSSTQSKVPAPVGWLQEMWGAAAGGQQQQQDHSRNPNTQQKQAKPTDSDSGARTNSGSTGFVPPGLPLPLLWELPKALQQIANRSQTPAGNTPTAAAAGAAANTADDSSAAISHAAVQHRVLARELATSLRHWQPSGNSTPSSRASSSSDDGAVQLLGVLQQLRERVSAEAWAEFADAVQLAAADALQLTVVETAVTASVADAESFYTDTLSMYGEEQPTAAVPHVSQGAAAAAAGAHVSGIATMSMSGRHMITQLPAVSSAVAVDMQRQQQQQQQVDRLVSQVAASSAVAGGDIEVQQQQQQQQQNTVQTQSTSHQQLLQQDPKQQQHQQHQQQQQQQEDAEEQEQVEGHSHAVAAALAAAAAEEELRHQVATKLHTLRGQLKQYTEQHHQQQQKLAAAAKDKLHVEKDQLTVLQHQQQQQQQEIDESTAAEASSNGDPTLGSSSSSGTAFPKYEYLVFGGGGARCFGYTGALHALRQLGLVGRLKGVSGSSGGAVYALLAALRFSVPEVQAAMGTLPETENLSWFSLNSRLGLSDGEQTFRQIEAAIATKLGVPHPTLCDVAAAAGCPITLAATSLARRAPVYLSSTTHPNMPVRDALRASCAIPFFFTPFKLPGSSSSSSEGIISDLLVDGCITDCTPLAGLSVGGGAGWDPKKTLVLAVHDAAGLDSPDFQGLLAGLVSTVMQAGLHHTLAAGIDLLNLWPAVAGVNPLQFRMPVDQARDVIARSQALAEEFAVNKMKQWAAAAVAAVQPAGADQQQQQHASSSRDSLHGSIGAGSSDLSNDTNNNVTYRNNTHITDEDWDEAELIEFRGWEEEGDDDDDNWQQQQQQQQRPEQQQQQWQQHSQVHYWQQQQQRQQHAYSTVDSNHHSTTLSDVHDDLSSKWLGRLADERLLRAALHNVGRGDTSPESNTQQNNNITDKITSVIDGVRSESPSPVLASHLSESEWRIILKVLEQQERILQQQEQAAAAARQQRQQEGEGSDLTVTNITSDSCGLSGPKELFIRESGGISQVCLVTASVDDTTAAAAGDAGGVSSSVAVAGGSGGAMLSNLASADRDCMVPIISSMEEWSLFD